MSDKDLADIGQYQIPSEKPGFRFAAYLKRIRFQNDLNKFLADERVLAVMDHGREHGRLRPDFSPIT